MLLKLAALSAIGYAGYKYYEKNFRSQNQAFASGQAGGSNFAQIRDSGPEAMADGANRNWSKTDEEIDQSFPASDPPANY